MTRRPFSYLSHRSIDAEGGGAADLQTDVMRFIAILAICLVVIFALVQSIPLAPVETSPPRPEPGPVPQVVPEPQPVPAAEPETEPSPAPTPEPAAEAATPVVEPPPPAPPVTEDGFTLRFESDLALTRLVDRNVVGLYAIDGQRALRMNYSRGRTSFWDASMPNRFHEMERATVPADVVRALLRSAELDATAVQWGVTLPADMQDELNAYLQSAESGSLVIAADGRLRLEH